MKQTGDLNSQLIEFELKEFTNIRTQILFTTFRHANISFNPQQVKYIYLTTWIYCM